MSDEIEDLNMTPAATSYGGLIEKIELLRALQSQEIQRVGSDQVIDIDTRIVAATNKDLLQMSREGRFREDLYYRLSVIHLTLPALRERRDELCDTRSDAEPFDLDTARLSEIKRAASDEAEKAFPEQALQQVSGRVADLARRINMNRSHLQTVLKKHGIRSKDYRRAAVGGNGVGGG
jgi:DNA-binding NtrC family response regulator